ncbi:DUF2827 family protein [Burkholderia cepacia]|uniref:DUF2827 family protein n=1 Tax=Burkholderia cepacia TaxID=292 RepID=UPI000A7AE274
MSSRPESGMTISFHCANDFTMKPFHYGWDPICVEERSATLPHRGEYRPTGQARRLSVVEPNIDVTKA